MNGRILMLSLRLVPVQQSVQRFPVLQPGLQRGRLVDEF